MSQVMEPEVDDPGSPARRLEPLADRIVRGVGEDYRGEDVEDG